MQHIRSGSAARGLRNDGMIDRPVSDARLTATHHGLQCHVKPPVKVTIVDAHEAPLTIHNGNVLVSKSSCTFSIFRRKTDAQWTEPAVSE